MKKLSLLLGVILLTVFLTSCGSDSPTSTTGGSNPVIFTADSISVWGSASKDSNYYFQTTKRAKLSVEFTGETNCGDQKFSVVIEGKNSEGGLASITIFTSPRTAGEFNKTVTIESGDLSSLDPLFLHFKVSLVNPGAFKYVKIKGIKVTAL